MIVKHKKEINLNRRRIQMKKILYALLLTVFLLTMSVGSADAAWTSSFTTAKKILLNANATTLATQSAANTITYTLGAGETLNTNDTLILTLTGGAKFTAVTPTLTTSSGPLTVVGSPTGLTTANYRVATLASVGDSININAEALLFNVASVTGNVDIGLSATTSVGSLPIFNSLQSSKTGASFAFSAPSAMESVAILASTNTADVSATTGAFKKFTGASLVSTANAIGFSYTNLSEVANTSPNGQEISAGKIVFNISGVLTGITTVSGTGCTGSNAAGSTTGGTAAFFLIDTAKTNAYCINTLVLAPATTLALVPQFTLDGTTAQPARGFSASVAFLADGTKWAAHTPLTATSLYSITRNGSSFVTNSVGARNTIKITDRSNGMATAGGAITITAWDVNGVSIPDAGTALLLQNNATTTITGPALALRFPTGTPIKYEFSVESSSIDVTNVKASTDGTFSATTVYTSGGGGAL